MNGKWDLAEHLLQLHEIKKSNYTWLICQTFGKFEENSRKENTCGWFIPEIYCLIIFYVFYPKLNLQINPIYSSLSLNGQEKQYHCPVCNKFVRNRDSVFSLSLPFCRFNKTNSINIFYRSCLQNHSSFLLFSLGLSLACSTLL